MNAADYLLEMSKSLSDGIAEDFARAFMNGQLVCTRYGMTCPFSRLMMKFCSQDFRKKK